MGTSRCLSRPNNNSRIFFARSRSLLFFASFILLAYCLIGVVSSSKFKPPLLGTLAVDRSWKGIASTSHGRHRSPTFGRPTAAFAVATIRGGQDSSPTTAAAVVDPITTVPVDIATTTAAAAMTDSNATTTTASDDVTKPKWTWTDARRTLFPIYGEKEVTKFLLIGSIKFFIILALTLTRDTKDTLVVTQCGAEAIAFLKVRLFSLFCDATVRVVPYVSHGTFLSICLL